MNQTIKVEAVNKQPRQDRNGNLFWGVLYKGNWINVHRQEEPKKGESITGDLQGQQDSKDLNKTWWHLYPPIENPPKLAPEPQAKGARFDGSGLPKDETPQKPTFEQALLAIETVRKLLAAWDNPEASAAVIQTVLLRIGAGEILPPEIKADPMANEEAGNSQVYTSCMSSEYDPDEPPPWLVDK